jgi:hypothetical protein
MEIHAKIHSGVFSQRCIFENDNYKNDKKKPGIRCYSNITSFFLKLFGLGNKIIDIKIDNKKTIHLNKSSLQKWLSKHYGVDTSKIFKSRNEFVEGIKMTLVSKKAEKLTPEQKEKAAYNTVTSLFGKEKDFDQLPVLDIGDRIGDTGYIDFISPEEMSAPIMRGKDQFGREFFVVRATNTKDGKKTCYAFFQRYKPGSKDGNGTWVDGKKEDLPCVFTKEGNSIGTNFRISGGYVFPEYEKNFEVFKQFIANKGIDDWKIE